jgi:hypothetical protein
MKFKHILFPIDFSENSQHLNSQVEWLVEKFQSGTADAAGIDWQSAVYRKVQEEVKADRGLTIERMVELGRVSRSGFYRFDDNAQRCRADRPQIRTCKSLSAKWDSRESLLKCR